MKYLFISFLCCFISVANGQVDSVELPKGDKQVKITKATFTLSFYIDQSENVYLEEDPILIKEIGVKLKEAISAIPKIDRLRTVIFLYVDKNSSYSILDKVKTEIASLDIRKTVYKTGSLGDEDFLTGVYWKNYPYNSNKNNKEKPDVNANFIPIPKTTTDKKIPPPPPPPPPPPFHWTYLLEKDIYSGQERIVEKVVVERSTSCITATNKGVLYNSRLILLENEKELIELFTSFDVLFLDFDTELLYDSYLNTIKSIKKTYKNIPKGIKPAFLVELSSRIKVVHMNNKSDFCQKRK